MIENRITSAIGSPAPVWSSIARGLGKRRPRGRHLAIPGRDSQGPGFVVVVRLVPRDTVTGLAADHGWRGGAASPGRGRTQPRQRQAQRLAERVDREENDGVTRACRTRPQEHDARRAGHLRASGENPVRRPCHERDPARQVVRGRDVWPAVAVEVARPERREPHGQPQRRRLGEPAGPVTPKDEDLSREERRDGEVHCAISVEIAGCDASGALPRRQDGHRFEPAVAEVAQRHHPIADEVRHCHIGEAVLVEVSDRHRLRELETKQVVLQPRRDPVGGRLRWSGRRRPAGQQTRKRCRQKRGRPDGPHGRLLRWDCRSVAGHGGISGPAVRRGSG
jgi:hypothetical protein